MAKFEIVSVGVGGQYTVKEHIDVTGIADRIANFELENSNLVARNADLDIEIAQLQAELDSLQLEIEALLLLDPPDYEGANNKISFRSIVDNGVTRLVVEQNRNELRVQSNLKKIAPLQSLLDSQNVVLSALCVDGDDSLTVGQLVGSVEFHRFLTPKDGVKKILIRPGTDAVYNAVRDGLQRHAMVMGPSELFVNAALMPAAQETMPRFVPATVDSVDVDNDAISATPYEENNNHPSSWWEGAGKTRLPTSFFNNIPVVYRTCNAEAFEVGDQVVVEYIADQPTVVGFVDNPRACPSGFLAVATPIDYVAACGIECDAAFEVDWGDGIFLPYAAGRQDVVPTGVITVRGVGVVTWFRFHTNTFSAIDVQQSSTVTSLNRSFIQLYDLASFAIADTSNVTDFYFAWYYCRSLTSFPVIDCSSAVGDGKFTATWSRCLGLLSFPLINTTNVTHFNSTWGQCLGLTSFPLIDTSSAVYLGGAWSLCEGLTSFPLIDTSNVEIFDSAWYQNSSLSIFPSIDLSSGVSFYNTWRRCFALVEIAATNMTSAATSLRYVCEASNLLTTISGTWDTSGVANWSHAFAFCESLDSSLIPIFSFSSALMTDSAFLGCISLTYMGYINCALATNVSSMLSGCTHLICIAGIDLTSATTRTYLFSSTPLLVAPTSLQKTQLESGALITYTNPSPCP